MLLQAFDVSVIDWLNGHVGLSDRLDALVLWASSAHMVKGGVLAAVLWGLWFSPGTAEVQTLRRSHLIAAMVASLIGEFIARVMALGLPFRNRPIYDSALHLHVAGNLQVDALERYSSFPSDHAVFFFAVATGVVWASRWVGGLMLLYVTFAICLPRMYFGLHYPTDILAGAAIGALMAWALQQDAARTRLAAPLLAWERRAPGWFYALACYFTLQFGVLFEGPRSFLKLLHGLGQGASV